MCINGTYLLNGSKGGEYAQKNILYFRRSTISVAVSAIITSGLLFQPAYGDVNIHAPNKIGGQDTSTFNSNSYDDSVNVNKPKYRAYKYYFGTDAYNKKNGKQVLVQIDTPPKNGGNTSLNVGSDKGAGFLYISKEGTGIIGQENGRGSTFQGFSVGDDSSVGSVPEDLDVGAAAGVIWNDGTLKNYNSTYINNGSNNNTSWGGAIVNFGSQTDIGTTYKGNKVNKQGGAIFNRGDLNMANNTFESNTANGHAGAIYNMYGRIIDKGSLYAKNETGNDSILGGGAIRNGGGDFVDENGALYGDESGKYSLEVTGSAFVENKAGLGGAIYNSVRMNASITGSYFGNNESTKKGKETDDNRRGGAIYNWGHLELKTGKLEIDKQTAKANTFENNVSANKGGAIYNDNGSTLIDEGYTYSGNTAKEGGAIYNAGGATFSQNAFTGNGVVTDDVEDKSKSDFAAIRGGAVFNSDTGTITFNIQENKAGIFANIDDSAFHEKNIKEALNSIKNTRNNNEASDGNNKNVFRNNQTVAQGDDQSNSGLGGAIYNTGSLTDEGYSYLGNSSYNGGAIYNGLAEKAEKGGIAELSGNTFKRNSAANKGGAIYNSNGSSLSLSDAVMYENTAKNGGAIYNEGTLTLTNTGFDSNKGSAIHNDTNGSITLLEINAFQNNTASQGNTGEVLNDIVNDGTLSLGKDDSFSDAPADAKSVSTGSGQHRYTYIGGGITGSGKLNHHEGILEIAGGVRKVEQNNITFHSGSITRVTVGDSNIVEQKNVVHYSELDSDKAETAKNKSYIIKAAGALTIEDGARLQVGGANAGNTYIIASASEKIADSGNGWKDNHLALTDIDSSNILLDIKRVDGDAEEGAVMISSEARKAKEILPCVDIPDNLNDLAGNGRIDVDSTASGIKFLSRATDLEFMKDKAQMEQVINSAAQIATAGAVKNVTYSGAGMFNRAVEKHLSLSRTLQLNPQVSLHEKEHTDLWVDLIGMHQRNHGMPTCSGKECGDNTRFGHRIDIGGIIAGIDRSFDENRHVGVAWMAGTGSASSKGSASHTKNDVDFWGLSVYGGYDRDNWNVMGNVSYAHFDSDIDQSLPSSLQMGNKLRADVSSHLWSAGVRGEYRIRFDNGVSLLPHAGLRYDRIVTSGFQTKADEGAVFNTRRDTQNIYSLPLGMGIQGAFVNKDSWTFRPQADLTAIFATGDVRDRTRVSAVGLDATDSISTRIVDRSSVAAGVGFDMQKGNKSFGLHYDALYSSRQMWQGLMAKVVYKFE